MTGNLLPSLPVLRRLVEQVIADKDEQGHDVISLRAELAAAPASYDALLELAARVRTAPMRADWPYVEPDDWAGITAEWDADDLTPASYDRNDVRERIRTAFLARVCGCILGKPFEFDPTLEELRGVLEPAGEWPLTDYVTEASCRRLRELQPQWPDLVRERIRWAAEDDDLNYTVLGMLLLEQHGAAFTGRDVRWQWLLQLPIRATFGPERTQLLAAGVASLDGDDAIADDDAAWAAVLNPGDEHCGALIRADAYGYACPGDPARAARLAWQDASTTHRRTGVYGCMLVAAAISVALVTDPADRLAPFRIAKSVLPRRSRFAAIVDESLAMVESATDWLDGYRKVHGRFGEYTHCRVYQEIGTVMNTLRFASDVGEGLGLQVCQGNDTDSFGATAGSLLGALLGPQAFDRRWVAPFNDRIHLALAVFHEASLSAVAERMSRLPDVLGPDPTGATQP
jgi:ADP-ribosylglycohydrolase